MIKTCVLNKKHLNVIDISSGAKIQQRLKYEWDSSEQNNTEFVRVYVDADNKMLYGVRVDSSILAPEGVPSDILKDIKLLERKNR